MSRLFYTLCDHILFRLTSDSSKDALEKDLSLLLNQLTEYVAIGSRSEEDDQAIAVGLQMLLLMDLERVRAAALRALRYAIHRPTIAEKFSQYHLDYLVCRSLIVDNRNDRERLEAHKLIRRFFKLYPEHIPHSFIHALNSIISSSYNNTWDHLVNPHMNVKTDQMITCSLELLCEIALLNPLVLHECHALDILLKYITYFNQDELIESVIYTLLHAINRFSINDNTETVLLDSVDPDGPSLIFVDEGMRERHQLIKNIFNQLVVVFATSDQGKLKIDENRGMISAGSELSSLNHIRAFKACSTALRTILRSWIGLIAFGQSKNSSIRLLVNSLIMQSEVVQISIIDLFFELLNLDVPPMSDNYPAVLKAIHPKWVLTTMDEGYTYVASEGAEKLPRLSSTRPNLLDSHTALLLLTLIDAGFIEAVSELVSAKHSILSVRATLLLANFIWLCNEHLPEEQSFLLLPLLMDNAIADDEPVKRSIAREAIFRMNEFFQFKQRFHRQCSFQLSQLILHAYRLNDYFTLTKNLANEGSRRISSVQIDDPLEAEKIDGSIRDTNTLQIRSFRKWNWDLILSLLKDFPQLANRMQGDLYERFLDKLFDFFKPEEPNGFRAILLTDPLSDVTCRSLLAFADLLIYPSRSTSNHIRSIASDIVRSLLQSIANAFKQSIAAVRDGTGKVVLTEQDLLSTNSTYYYLFLGRLSKSSIGTQVLQDSDIFVYLSEMLKMDDDFGTSVVVALSSFNYYYDGPCRTFLAQVLKSSCTELRIYSTKLLRVVLRCNPVAFGQWGLTLLSSQLYDTNPMVVIEAVSTLDEALEDKRLVTLFYKQWEKLSALENRNPYLSEIYHMACSRLCSIPFNQVVSEEKHLRIIERELSYWDQFFNSRYVTIMETRLFSAYSGVVLLTDDFFERRRTPSDKRQTKRKPVTNIHVSAHIYRQLSLHHDGFEYLRRHSRLEQYAQQLTQHPTNCVDTQEAQQIKEALWVLGHTASTNIGFNWFSNKDLLAHFLRFAEECQNLAVRGTAFYTLSLIAQTPDGAMSLKDFGWETYRVRAHSIAASVANTDTSSGAERRMSRAGTMSPPHQRTSSPANTPTITVNDKKPTNPLILGAKTSDPSSAGSTKDASARRADWKSKRASTLPSHIHLPSHDHLNAQHDAILEENGSVTPTNNMVTVSFPDHPDDHGDPLVITVPIRRYSMTSRDIYDNLTPTESSAMDSEGSLANLDRSRSSSYKTYTSYNQSSSIVSAPVGESLPLERYCPRFKSAHRSNRLRQLKQLEKVPEVIQSLLTPGSSDDMYPSRILRCNFLLKPDAAGYDYARRVQELSHATYSFALKNNALIDSSPISFKQKDDQFVLPVHRSISEFEKKITELYYSDQQRIENFSLTDGKFSLDEVDFDDADQDGNTIYRGLAVPVDIRQVLEISNGLNLNYETWSELARSRSRSCSRANTNIDMARGRSGTTGSTGSGEFAPAAGSSFSNISFQELPPSSFNFNLCMMCLNPSSDSSHENTKLTSQKEFHRIKYLASQLMVNIRREEIERELLSLKQSRPDIFDSICLYSEICYLFTLSNVRIGAQRFLHDLFSDCQFQMFRERYRRQTNVLLEEDQEEIDSDESETDVE